MRYKIPINPIKYDELLTGKTITEVTDDPVMVNDVITVLSMCTPFLQMPATVKKLVSEGGRHIIELHRL